MDIRALYICYFGLREPLVQTQVLPYLRELSAAGVKVHLLTFEADRGTNWSGSETAQWRERLRGEGIHWLAASYRHGPTLLAKTLDLVTGTLRVIALARKYRIGVLHARSDMAAAMAWLATKVIPASLLFDVRGLMADEYAESGHWIRGGLPHRVTQWAERQLFRRADAFVVLTQRAREEFFKGERRPIEVIPCCVDLERFRSAHAERDRIRARLGAASRTIIVYSGTVGGSNSNSQQDVVQIFAAARVRDPSVFALVLTNSARDSMSAALRDADFGPADHYVTAVSPAEVPSWLAAADIGLSLAGAGHSRITRSPAKFAEYLASGLPVIASPGVGDLDAQIERERIGVVLRSADGRRGEEAFARIQELRRDPELRGRCLALAESSYDLRLGAARYRRIYAELTRWAAHSTRTARRNSPVS